MDQSTRSKGKMRNLRSVVKLAAETALISTVGSFFWIALGRQVVHTYGPSDWNYAGGGATFWHFFVGIVQLYLLYRVIRWLIELMLKQLAKRVGSRLSGVRTFGNVRNRVAQIFMNRWPFRKAAPEEPTSPLPRLRPMLAAAAQHTSISVTGKESDSFPSNSSPPNSSPPNSSPSNSSPPDSSPPDSRRLSSMRNVHELTAAEAARAIASRQITATQLAEA